MVKAIPRPMNCAASTRERKKEVMRYWAWMGGEVPGVGRAYLEVGLGEGVAGAEHVEEEHSR